MQTSLRIPDWVQAFDATRVAVISHAVEHRQSVTQAVMRHRLATFEPRIAKAVPKMRGLYGAELSASEQSVLLRLLDTRRARLALSFEREYGRAKMRSERPKDFSCLA